MAWNEPESGVKIATKNGGQIAPRLNGSFRGRPLVFAAATLVKPAGTPAESAAHSWRLEILAGFDSFHPFRPNAVSVRPEAVFTVGAAVVDHQLTVRSQDQQFRIRVVQNLFVVDPRLGLTAVEIDQN